MFFFDNTIPPGKFLKKIIVFNFLYFKSGCPFEEIKWLRLKEIYDEEGVEPGFVTGGF